MRREITEHDVLQRRAFGRVGSEEPDDYIRAATTCRKIIAGLAR